MPFTRRPRLQLGLVAGALLVAACSGASVDSSAIENLTAVPVPGLDADGSPIPGASPAPDVTAPNPPGVVPPGTATTPPNPRTPRGNNGGTPPPAPSESPPPVVVPPPTGSTGSAAGPGVIGYAGCSVTTNAYEGFEDRGGTRFWPSRGLYSGGSIAKWARSIGTDMGLWKDFHALLAANPKTAGVWFGLCTASSDGSGDIAYNYAVTALDEVRRLLPGVPIWVSAQPEYVNHDCGIAGPNGPAAMAALADRLVDDGLALAGPVLGPLTEPQTIDGCHANNAGRQLMGQQLMDFFGAHATDGAVGQSAGGGPGGP